MYHSTKRRSTSMRPWLELHGRSRRETGKRMKRRSRRAPHKRLAAVALLTIILAVSGLAGTDTSKTEYEVMATFEIPMISAGCPDPIITEPEPEGPVYYDVPLEHDLQDVVFQEADRWGVPAALLLAMMEHESNYQADVISSTGDYGIMQINEINHQRLREALGITDFLDPEQSIACGAYMIGSLLAEYDGDVHHALTAYNRGEGGARAYYRETGTYETDYSREIVATYEALGGGDDTCR